MLRHKREVQAGKSAWDDCVDKLKVTDVPALQPVIKGDDLHLSTSSSSSSINQGRQGQSRRAVLAANHAA